MLSIRTDAWNWLCSTSLIFLARCDLPLPGGPRRMIMILYERSLVSIDSSGENRWLTFAADCYDPAQTECPPREPYCDRRPFRCVVRSPRMARLMVTLNRYSYMKRHYSIYITIQRSMCLFRRIYMSAGTFPDWLTIGGRDRLGFSTDRASFLIAFNWAAFVTIGGPTGRFGLLLVLLLFPLRALVRFPFGASADPGRIGNGNSAFGGFAGIRSSYIALC